jgi:hypothetical protein
MPEGKRGQGSQPFLRVHDDTPTAEPTPVGADQLAAQIRETADKFVRDGATRGDLKLVSTALKELRYCFKVMSQFRDTRMVTAFGSARLPASDPAYAVAEEFGRRMAAAGYMVITGGGGGIMEAAHVGAGRDRSIGFNILLPFEQRANPVIDGDRKSMHLKYFFTRKLMFVKEADAVALFPGGFGTQDEGFEVLTLVQTGKSHLFPIVLLDAPGGDYWVRWQAFIVDVLLKRRLISPEDLSLYKLCGSAEEAVEEVLSFYRVYQGMRYVGKDLVLRLAETLGEEALARLRADFADILVSGTFEQGGPLPAEGDEYPGMNRLRFHFNRRDMGRLRQLVDRINHP